VSYREFSPPAVLRHYLTRVWVRTTGAEGTERQVRVFPDGCIDLVWMGEEPPFIAGPATRPALVSLPPDSPIVGVRFRPGMATSLLGPPASALRNADVPLADVWGVAASRLHDTSGPSQPAPARLAALQESLVARLPQAAPADALVLAGIRALRRRTGIPVWELADTLGVSERQLLRRFDAAVGYGPRTFARVLRFQRAVRLGAEAAAGGRLHLADLAATLAYADQAHLTREFAEFAGASPSSLLARWDPAVGMSDPFKTTHRPHG
jgi:AraC-like DNA-binding protein